jgi:uncharacterized membrane protein (DUF373 family)
MQKTANDQVYQLIDCFFLVLLLLFLFVSFTGYLRWCQVTAQVSVQISLMNMYCGL